MSKRSASDNLTKDGSTPIAVPPERQVKMATAAQLANRKISTPKSRINRGPVSAGTPFQSVSSNTINVNSFQPNSQSQTFTGINGAPTFGESKSFPPGIATPSGGFTFQPPQSASFTFGQTAPPSNPFSDFSSNLSNTQSDDTQSADDAMMESPRKKTFFGSNFNPSNGSASSSTPFLFGQSTQPNGLATSDQIQGMGAGANSPPVFGGITSKPTEQPGNSFGFGQSQPTTQTPPNPFTFSQPTQQSQASPFKFGQSQPSQQPPTNMFKFGQSQPAQPAQGFTPSAFGQSEPNKQPSNAFGGFGGQKSQEPPQFSSTFGQASSNFGSFGQPASSTSKNASSFGQANASADASNSFASHFGQDPTSSERAKTPPIGADAVKPDFKFLKASQTTGAKFGETTSQKQNNQSTISDASNVFDFASTPQTPSNISEAMTNPPQNSETAPQIEVTPNTGKTFATPSTNSTFPSDLSMGSAGLSPLPSSSTETSTPQSTGFGFAHSQPQSNSSSGGIFSATKSTGSENTDGSRYFGRVTRAESNDQQVSSSNDIDKANVASSEASKTFGGATQQGKITTNGESLPASTTGSPAWGGGSFFEHMSQPPQTNKQSLGSTGAALISSSKDSNKPRFGFLKPQGFTPTPTSFSANSITSSNQNAISEGRKAQSSFGISSVPSAPSNTASGTSSNFLAPSIVPATTGNEESSTSASAAKVKARPDILDMWTRSSGAGHIPNYLSNDERATYDRTYRLHALHRGFQKRVATLDPAKHDFENIIRHYVSVRESVGCSLGLYQRNVAGMKRKVDDGDERENDGSSSNKRSRADSPTINPAPADPAASKSKAFGSVSNAPESAPKSKASVGPDVSKASSPKSDASIIFPASFQDAALSSATNAAGEPLSGVSTDKPQNPFSFFNAPASNTSKDGSTLSNPQASATSAVPVPSNPFASFDKTPASTSNLTSSSGAAKMFSASLTAPTESASKGAQFKVPAFSTGGATNFMAAFAKSAAKSADDLEKEAKAKRKAEDFDSEDDDEEEWERKYEEEQRAKRAKLESLAKGGAGFIPSFGKTTPSASASPVKVGLTHAAENNSQSTAPGDSFTYTAPSLPTDSTGNTSSTAGQPAGFRPLSFDPAPPPESEKKPGSELDSEGDARTEEEREESEGSQSASQEGQSSDRGQSGRDDSYEETYEDDEADDEETGDPMDEEASGDKDDESSEDDLQVALARSRNKGRSLFERIEPNPSLKNTDSAPISEAKESSEKPNTAMEDSTKNGNTYSEPPILQKAPNSSFRPHLVGSEIFKTTPKAPPISPFTPVNVSEPPKEPFKLATTFNYDPPVRAVTPTPIPGASIFSGGILRHSGPLPGEGLFGSRPSTPSNIDNPGASVFGNAPRSTNTFSPRSDNTWKAGEPIKFGTPDKERDAPSFNFTVATPPPKEGSETPKPYSTLFGASGFAASKPISNAAGNVGFGFGVPSSLPSFLGAAPHLGFSATNSATSSRATSPGATDNESIATSETEDLPNDPQTSLMTSRPGEENEEVLFEARSKALKFITPQMVEGIKTNLVPKEYNTMGVGIVRVLRNKETGKTRIVFRAEPASNIIINSNLHPKLPYESDQQGKSGTVRLGIFASDSIEKWVLKVKTKAMADELATILKENRGA